MMTRLVIMASMPATRTDGVAGDVATARKTADDEVVEDLGEVPCGPQVEGPVVPGAVPEDADQRLALTGDGAAQRPQGVDLAADPLGVLVEDARALVGEAVQGVEQVEQTVG